jgi:hypothetical protein
MSTAAGALFTIAGANFSGSGVRIDSAVGPPAIFGAACDLWVDLNTNATVASGVLTSITERSFNATVLSGSIPYTPNARGTLAGISNHYGSAGSTTGYIQTPGAPKSLYDWNKPFSVSVAFIYGGHPAGNVGSILFSGVDHLTAFGCGFEISPGGGSLAFGGDKLMIQMKPYSASGADGGYVLVYGNETFTAGNLYKVHVTYDGSGSAAGLAAYINDAAEGLNVYANNVLSSTWINTANPQPVQMFDSVSPMYGTFLELFTVSREYTTSDLAAAEAWLDGRYT